MTHATFPRLWLLTFLIAMLFGSACACAEADGKEANMLVNGGFQHGLAGWTAEGDVTTVSSPSPLGRQPAVRLGPARSAVRQRYAIGGSRIVLFKATLKEEPTGLGALARVRCYDEKQRMVMELTQGIEPKKEGDHGADAGIYFKTQAHTASIVVSIEKDSETPGYVYAGSADLDDYDRDRVAHAPLCNVREYMQPIWRGETVYNETVLLVSEGGKPASGRLLFTPKRILSARDYGLNAVYVKGKDYELSGNVVTCAPGSRMPSVKDSDFPTVAYPWYEADGKHIVVTYTHESEWQGPVPSYEGARLPRTMHRLQARQTLTIVALGDSITLGDNVSGYMQYPPYMPTWAELFAGRLKETYGDPGIQLYNAALGGMTSTWGLQNADSAVASLDPDLVIVAFGMNDFWSVSGDEFRANIKGIIDRVRAKRPHAEFVLISSMQFDPAYTSEAVYSEHMASYAAALKSLADETPGAALLDMYSISRALYAAKKPKDLVANPLHPNDFLARWYAQGLVALLDKPDRR